MKRHPLIPGVYRQFQEAGRFINSSLIDNAFFAQKKPWIKPLMTWFETQDNKQFPIIYENDISTDHISFTNGVFCISTNSFTLWEDVKTPPLTIHYYELPYNAELQKKPTPLWDNLVSHQMTVTVGDIFEAMIGRLFSPLGSDNWQVAAFLKGDADTVCGPLSLSLLIFTRTTQSHSHLHLG